MISSSEATKMSFVGKLEVDVEIKAPAAEFHDVISGRPHHISKVSPAHIQSCEIHEGEWGKPGSVIFWNYTHSKPCYIFFNLISTDFDLLCIFFPYIIGLGLHYKLYYNTI